MSGVVRHLSGGGLIGLLTGSGLTGIAVGLLISPLIEIWVAPFVRACLAFGARW
jgi:hypothetical protein